MNTLNTMQAPWSAARALLVFLTAALPVALCGAGVPTEAEARRHPLIVADQRAAVGDALRESNLAAVETGDRREDARLAVDDRDDTAWSGRADSAPWTWTARFVHSTHIALVRAHWGTSTTRGVPVAYEWQSLAPAADGSGCALDPPDEDRWSSLGRARPSVDGAGQAQPTRHSWFVDADACGLRLVVEATNGGAPVLREVKAIEGARDVLRDAEASDDGDLTGFPAANVIDGSYAARWVGAPGRSHWTVRIDLRNAQPIDRVRLVLGLDATSVARTTAGRSYSMAWGPLRYSLETSDDGLLFEPVATEPRQPDGSILPLRRRLVRFAAPRVVRALRLAIDGATDADGRPDVSAVPVVREVSAYRADDPRPILAEPWVLSINANPSGQTHVMPGGELADDVRHAKLLQARFAPLLAPLGDDDLEARWRSGAPEGVDEPASDRAGEALESIEGDDPQLGAMLLADDAPPPVAVLSGSNDWDYATEVGPDAAAPRRWHWDPLLDAPRGMGGLAAAVRQRTAPFLGFCGGAQILGLLAAEPPDAEAPLAEEARIDDVLRRTTGAPIRGFGSPAALERGWPGDVRRARPAVDFAPQDPLFADLAGSSDRSLTRAMPLCHTDAVRADAFLPGGPLDRFDVVATSTFCGPDVVATSSRDSVFADPRGPGSCRLVPQAFRSRDRAWPIIAAQFHPEQRTFAMAAPGDPPESVADPRLFLDAAYELVVDAHLKLAP